MPLTYLWSSSILSSCQNYIVMNCGQNLMWKRWSGMLLFSLLILLMTACTKESLEDGVPILDESELKGFNVFSEYELGGEDGFYYKGKVNDDIIEIIIPKNWDGDVFVVYAHGYVDPVNPIEVPDDYIGAASIKGLLTSMGVAYAATSYSETGFVVKEAIEDVKFLGNLVKAHFKSAKLILGGVSEGGLVAIKTLEKYKNIFDAGLVTCAPVGNFQKQIDYFGNFHVLFNCIYHDEIEMIKLLLGDNDFNMGSPAYVPPKTMQLWADGVLQQLIFSVITAPESQWKLPVLLNLANVPVDWSSPTLEDDLVSVVGGILRFNIMATNDLVERMHGVPFDNTKTDYPEVFIPGIGMLDLDNCVIDIEGDKQAMLRVKLLFETVGSISVPIYYMHTEYDPITPVWHMSFYDSKVVDGNLLFTAEKYGVSGHCNFSIDDIVIALQVLLAEL